MSYPLRVRTGPRVVAAAVILAGLLESCGGAAVPDGAGGTSHGAGGTSTSISAGRAVFTGSSGCLYCHTLAAAGAKGTVGPDLDVRLRPDCAMLLAQHSHGTTLRQCIEVMIVHPYAFITSGYMANVMPSDFGAKLSSTRIEAVANFLAASAK